MDLKNLDIGLVRDIPVGTALTVLAPILRKDEFSALSLSFQDEIDLTQEQFHEVVGRESNKFQIKQKKLCVEFRDCV